jgi:2-polyprenyl-3-methyl-5-hydroxy-6-metoxy-1,4-benzoquinol methylase
MIGESNKPKSEE